MKVTITERQCMAVAVASLLQALKNVYYLSAACTEDADKFVPVLGQMQLLSSWLY